MIKFHSRSLRRDRGFFIFFGSRGIISNNGAAAGAVCPNCKQQSMIQPKSVRSWFTLFFIPIFPVGAKRTFSQCNNCRAQFRATPQQLSQHQAVSQQQQMQQAIQMYNSMRASPANSVTLNNLLLLYLQLREYNQAVSAANEFQQALNASEQCMTTLGRVLMEQGRHAEAIKWFDAALSRNAAIGEAAYCKAVSLMSVTPPDLAGAAIAARAARTAGLNGADALLKEIENRSRTSQA
jgi:tetratricopeptide (TPR) repeat protein